MMSTSQSDALLLGSKGRYSSCVDGRLNCGATENARPENDGVENDGQIPKELQGLENAGLENDGQTFSNLRPKLRALENAGLENDVPCSLARNISTYRGVITSVCLITLFHVNDYNW